MSFSTDVIDGTPAAPGPASSSHAFSAASPRSYGRSNSSTTSTGTTIVKVAMRSRDNVSSRRARVESDLTCRPPQVASTRDSGRQAAKNIRLVSAIVVAHESTRRRARPPGLSSVLQAASPWSRRPLREQQPIARIVNRSQHHCPVNCAASQVCATNLRPTAALLSHKSKHLKPSKQSHK